MANLRKTLGGLLTGAGLAANFIPGIGPVAGPIISMLAGAGGGALSGGAKGAALGGLSGFAGGSLASGALKTGAAAAGSGAATLNGLPLVPHAAGVSSALGGSSALAPAASKFTLGNILDIAKIAAPVGTAIYGQRSQNRALDRQSQLEQQNYINQIALAREQDAFRRSESDRVALEERRRWDIEQANRLKEAAAAEEERAFNRQLIEAREARRNDARMRLNEFLGRGRR